MMTSTLILCFLDAFCSSTTFFVSSLHFLDLIGLPACVDSEESWQNNTCSSRAIH